MGEKKEMEQAYNQSRHHSISDVIDANIHHVSIMPMKITLQARQASGGHVLLMQTRQLRGQER